MRPPHPARRQSGFTLIEIAIVLVIIGLLLGGI
ncbi:MAG: type II secretion system protein, partial [Thiobacillus sp.]